MKSSLWFFMTYTDVANQEQTLEIFQSFSVDDRLALLWQIYKTFGGEISQANSTDTAGYVALDSLIPEVQQMLPEEQLQVMRDLISGANTPIDDTYRAMNSSDHQIAFWYRLAQGMENKTIVQAPPDYQLPAEAQEFLSAINGVGFEENNLFFRNVVSHIGNQSK